MISVGLVLSAGGSSGDPWHAGVIAALHQETGWDARQAQLILGTSAGGITGLGLRAGISPGDRYAAMRGQAISTEGQAIYDRIVTPYSEGDGDTSWVPQAPKLAARALWPPWDARPLQAGLGLLPTTGATTDVLRQRLEELYPHRWPNQPFWVSAVRLEDGLRVVFGRDDIKATAAQAVQASCAVPVRYAPVAIGKRRYVDGGVHSSTNADLIAPLAYNVAIISSLMTADSKSLELHPQSAKRFWFSRKLRDEVSAIRRRGTPTLVLQPDAEAINIMAAEPSDTSRTDIAEAAYEATVGRLNSRDGQAFVSWLQQAAA